VPAYRVPLFDAIQQALSEHGIRFIVAAGSPEGVQALRGDAARPKWSVPLRPIGFRVGNRRVVWRRLPTDIRPDLVVSELEALNAFAWKSVWSRTPLILWGHGKSYVNDASKVAEGLKWALARRALGVMTYTSGGREYVIEAAGVDPSSVHAIGNSTDTTQLRSAFISVTPARERQLREEFGVGPRALFVGGLDASKRIDFLLRAALEAQRRDPNFKLLVVGRGQLEPLVQKHAVPDGPIVHIPEARAEELAELGHVAGAIWMPGRVGLVAVDALALGLPVCTTQFAYHAPEIEFLRGDELHYLPDNPRSFGIKGLQVATATSDPHRRALRGDIPSISAVAANFVDVVLGALA
jgi:glycosyltransferase involved in cell wall biosynthesis